MKNALLYVGYYVGFVAVFFIFFLLEKTFNPSFDSFEFGVITIGCFVLLPFILPFLNGLLKASEKADEKDVLLDENGNHLKGSNGKLVKVTQKESDKLLVHLHTLLEELTETKKVCSEAKLVHKIEKMEKHLMESEKMYQSISKLNQDKAAETLESILNGIRIEMDQLRIEQDEKLLYSMKKILLQRKN